MESSSSSSSASLSSSSSSSDHEREPLRFVDHEDGERESAVQDEEEEEEEGTEGKEGKKITAEDIFDFTPAQKRAISALSEKQDIFALPLALKLKDYEQKILPIRRLEQQKEWNPDLMDSPFFGFTLMSINEETQERARRTQVDEGTLVEYQRYLREAKDLYDAKKNPYFNSLVAKCQAFDLSMILEICGMGRDTPISQQPNEAIKKTRSRRPWYDWAFASEEDSTRYQHNKKFEKWSNNRNPEASFITMNSCMIYFAQRGPFQQHSNLFRDFKVRPVPDKYVERINGEPHKKQALRFIFRVVQEKIQSFLTGHLQWTWPEEPDLLTLHYAIVAAQLIRLPEEKEAKFTYDELKERRSKRREEEGEANRLEMAIGFAVITTIKWYTSLYGTWCAHAMYSGIGQIIRDKDKTLASLEKKKSMRRETPQEFAARRSRLEEEKERETMPTIFKVDATFSLKLQKALSKAKWDHYELAKQSGVKVSQIKNYTNTGGKSGGQPKQQNLKEANNMVRAFARAGISWASL